MKVLTPERYRSTDPLLEGEPHEFILDAVYAPVLYSNVKQGTAYKHPPGYVFLGGAAETDWQHNRPIYCKPSDEVMAIAGANLFEPERLSLELIKQDGGGVKLFARAFNTQCIAYFPAGSCSVRELGIPLHEQEEAVTA